MTWLLNLLKRSQHVLTIVALLVTLFGVGFALYSDRQPSVRYQILSNTSVLDVREKLGQLEVLYRGTSIIRGNRNLRVMVVRILNDGNKPIRKDMYDEDAPLGLTVSNGRLVEEPELVSASSDYLSAKVRPYTSAKGVVLFRSVILDPHAYFDVKLTVLTTQEDRIVIGALGKLAGIGVIPVDDAVVPLGSRSLLQRAFSGGSGTQLVRIVGYPIVFLIVIAVVALSVAGILEGGERLGRWRDVAKYRNSVPGNLSAHQLAVVEYYRTHGNGNLKRAMQLMANRKALKKVLSVRVMSSPEV